jgi:anaerobic magnesium-protoporphyrin IX monomethyl ester cyclase
MMIESKQHISPDRWTRLGKSPSVVLVRPPVSRLRLYRWYAPFSSREAPLGLIYLASHLSKNKINVALIDGEQVGRRKLIEKILSAKPAIIGLTSTTFSFFEAAQTIKAIRQRLPETIIIMGGPHVSAIPADTLLRIPQLDACVAGEGEETLQEICSGVSPGAINGLCWRDNHGNIIINPARPTCQNLDNYYPDWGYLENFPTWYQPGFQDRDKGRAISLVASRGCSHSCSFCAGSIVHGKRWRAHSPEFLINLMNDLRKKYSVRNFYFHDDNFTQNKEWLLEFCRMLIAEDISVYWSCASRIEPLDDQVLSLMRSAGCFQIGVGVESNSPGILQWLNKDLEIDLLEQKIWSIKKAGIDIKAYIIIGTPIETFGNLFSTLKFMLKLGISHIQVVYYTPLPGSSDGQRIPLSAKEWPKMNLLNPVAVSIFRKPILRVFELMFYGICYSRRFLKALLMRNVAHD